jgi:putative tryptophan/tyrosine transport system substrate-binding protein
MRRRDILTVIGGAAALTLPLRAQPLAVSLIGYIGPESPEPFTSRLKAFREGLSESGFAEGRNVAIEYRWAQGQYNRLPALAADLASRKPAVIVAAGGAPAALAAKSATSSITIVFEMGGDPVALGVVDSLSRPGGNLTGVSSLSVEVSRKRLEFMHELLPSATEFVIVSNPTSPTADSQLKNLQAAADALGVRLHVLTTSDEREFDAMFSSASQLRAAGLVFTSDPYFAFRSQRLAALATRYGVPAITQSRDFPIAGGLMSYGGDFTQSHRRAGIYAGRILNGEKPADLPVQLVTKVELFVNLKAAGTLGVTLPPSLISSADVVIE